MTSEEVDRMCDVLTAVDHGCPHCITDAMEHAMEEFPAYREQIRKRLVRFEEAEGVDNDD